MKDYEIFLVTGFILVGIIYILLNYNIKYKGKCILHDWRYKYDDGDYWKYNNKPYGRYLRINERYECKKCLCTKYESK